VELDRPAVNGRNQKRNCPVSSRHRRAVVEEFAGNGPLDRFSEGDQMQFRPATTAYAKPSQRDGRTHQFQKAPARPFVAVQLRCAGWKFALQPFAELRRVGQLIGASPIASPGSRCRWMLKHALHIFRCGEAFIDGMTGNSRSAECSTVLSKSVRS